MDTDEATSAREDSPVSELQPAPSASVVPDTEAVPDSFTRFEVALEKGVAEIRSEIRQRAESDRFRERQIEQLHAEVQSYRAGLIQQAAQQLMLGLVRLHDDVGKTVEALQKRPPTDLSPELFFVKLNEFQDDIELLLAQHGAERFEIPGDAFDPQRQTALRTVADPDAEKKGTLAFRIRPGFSRESKILQKERVAVFVTAPLTKDSPEGGKS
jgi:molecular chaperone GrpE